MSDTKILNFSLGPVQGFIAQARKTRDFWTGSFLLSYLSGQAMAVVLEGGGSLILPAVAKDKDNITDPLLRAIMKRRCGNQSDYSNRSKPRVATLPNRFRAEVPVDFDPDKCVQVIKEKWRELAAMVWNHYISEIADRGNSTKVIWQRQIKNFWEISWVIGENPAVLDLRKNWRSHVRPDEPGDKCTLFGDFQELSGYLRIREKEKQDKFWQAMREQEKMGMPYNLDENERLCSIALIKRFFPYVANELIFLVPINYPSTPYLAAINWIAKVIEENPVEAKKYAIIASSLPGVQGREEPDLFPVLREKLDQYPQARELATLDGNCFFKAALENANLWDRPSVSALSTEELRGELVKRLKELTKPTPFYAMLLMDGDLLGALLQMYDKSPEDISKSLSKFSLQAPGLIENENGVTVFAGGDDVLALLPLENALDAAIELRKAYVNIFEEKKIAGTISGAIVYCHYTTPLTEVYREAQRILSDVAKEKTGRDSLAVTVWKSAGRVLTWSAPWIIVTDQFVPFLKAFQDDLPADEELRTFSNSFFYNIQRRLALFTEDEGALKTGDLQDLLTAEYVKSRGPETDRKKARIITGQMLELCRPYWNDSPGNYKTGKGLLLDSLFLMKFLAEKGVD